jgi:branched-chain amino acid aminotransferase
MFICDFQDGKWSNPRIKPMELIPMHPASMALHYGQALFEGMKATIDSNGDPLLFRPDKNAERLNFSARRLGMPELSVALFVDALKQLVSLDKQWIPPQEGSALYLRPFMFADEAFIGMRAANSYKFIVMASPSKPIYTDRIRLYAETSFIRAAHGGTGEAKAAGNYAAAVLPTEIAKSKGFDQVLWLDAKEFKYIQEVGTMNIFFKINGQFVTPSLDGSILAGITRMSVIDFLRHKNFEVVERPITIDEIVEASKNGQLEEAFGTGTAVGIAMIQEIAYKDSVIHVSQNSPIGQLVLDTINGVRIGKITDELNWMVKVES